MKLYILSIENDFAVQSNALFVYENNFRGEGNKFVRKTDRNERGYFNS